MARATSAGMRVGSSPEAKRSRWLVATSTSRTKTFTSWSMMRLTDTMISSVTAVDRIVAIAPLLADDGLDHAARGRRRAHGAGLEALAQLAGDVVPA